MPRSTIFSALVILTFSACEGGIVFTEPQPIGVQPQAEIPANFHGNYMYYSDGTGSRINSHDLLLKIKKDSLIFLDFFTSTIEKNLIDSMNYELKDDQLYSEGKKISLLPVEFDGDNYYYVNRIDTIPFLFRENILSIEMPDSTVKIPAEIKTGDDYFALNVFSSFRDKIWFCYVFKKIENSKIEIRISPAFSTLDKKEMISGFKARVKEDLYWLTPKTKEEFEMIVSKVFIPAMTLQKMQD